MMAFSSLPLHNFKVLWNVSLNGLWVFLHQVPCAPQTRNNGDSKQHPSALSAVNDSLLEMVESQGAVGWREVQVQVVIQRVYCLPAREGYRSHTQGNKPLCAAPVTNSDPPNVR